MKLRQVVLFLGIAALQAATSLPAGNAEPTDTPKPAAEAASPNKPKMKAQCEPVTATRIRPSLKDGCKSAAAPFRKYSREEIERTGEIDMAEALRKTDPIFH